jgi:uncharacterized protein
VKARRTCMGCRTDASPSDLLRIVVAPDGVTPVVDGRARLPGRGAWVHPAAECLSRVTARPAVLRRSLRAPGLATESVGPQVRAFVLRGVMDGLTQASASGALIGGMDRLSLALSRGQVTWVATASDASQRTLETLEERAQSACSFIPVPLSKADLGGMLGSGARAAVGIVPTQGSVHLRRQLRRLRSLG